MAGDINSLNLLVMIFFLCFGFWGVYMFLPRGALDVSVIYDFGNFW